MINAIIGRYRILKKLGAGGMGEVFLAEDMELGRKAALKFLPPQYNAEPELKARFKREARAAAALNHPHIITIYDIGDYQGKTWMAMEYVDGESLKELIAREEPDIDEALDIVVQACEGLGEAHRAGILHRDIKPANILLDKNGRVKIADFGLARLEGATELSAEGAVMGTPAYMSPEQVRGKKLDGRSDIFSLGVTLYELITRRLPFKGETRNAVFFAILNDEPEPLARYKRGVPAGLQGIMDKALDKDREARYQHAADLRADLKRERKLLPQPGQSSTKPVAPKPPAKKPVPEKKRPLAPPPAAAPSSRRAWLLAGLALTLALLVWLVYKNTDRGQPLVEPALLSITTTPAEATVLLDGNAIGTTPITNYRAAAGKAALRIEKPPNYFPLDTTVVFVKGREAKFNFALKPATARVTIKVEPPDAEIILDNERLASPQLTRRVLTIGPHALNLSRENYQPRPNIRFRVTTTRDTTLLYSLKPELKAEYGVIQLLSRRAGKVYIDGNLKGDIAGGEQKEYDQVVGTHKIEVRSAKETFSQTLTVAKGQTVTVTLPPKSQSPEVVAEYGIIRVQAFLDGRVYIDGNLMGNIASGEAKEYDQTVGSHKVEVRGANETVSQNVSVAKGKTVTATLRPKPAPLPVETNPKPKYALRRTEKENLSTEAVKNMLKQKDFYCREGYDWSNPQGRGLDNDFVLQSDGKIVFDRSTGLMWQHGGSSNELTFANAQEYIRQLNENRFAGFGDWRLPTLEEAMSLMEPSTLNGDLYIDPKFDKTQRYIWTADKKSAGVAWVAFFGSGYCTYSVVAYNFYVRAVRVPVGQ